VTGLLKGCRGSALTSRHEPTAPNGDRCGRRSAPLSPALSGELARVLLRAGTRCCVRTETSASGVCCWGRRPQSWVGVGSRQSRRRPGRIRTSSREVSGRWRRVELPPQPGPLHGARRCLPCAAQGLRLRAILVGERDQDRGSGHGHATVVPRHNSIRCPTHRIAQQFAGHHGRMAKVPDSTTTTNAACCTPE